MAVLNRNKSTGKLEKTLSPDKVALIKQKREFMDSVNRYRDHENNKNPYRFIGFLVKFIQEYERLDISPVWGIDGVFFGFSIDPSTDQVLLTTLSETEIEEAVCSDVFKRKIEAYLEQLEVDEKEEDGVYLDPVSDDGDVSEGEGLSDDMCIAESYFVISTYLEKCY